MTKADAREATRPLWSLSIDSSTSLEDKLATTAALHACWKLEDLKGNDLVLRQRQQCKEVDRILFGFDLQETQVDAICTIFYD